MYLGTGQDLAHARAGGHDVVLSELCGALFESLPRSDQRRKGVDYVRGLLTAQGRKTIRNIAAVLPGQVDEQALHHFICSSTWDWTPVRQSLARYLARVVGPKAWVVRPVVIPKAGRHSVGVDRRFFSDPGQVLNAQLAIGVWAASDELSNPVNWRLHLSQAWLDDKRRRAQASIPDGLVPETVGDCAIEAYLETVACWDLPVRPAVLDGLELDAYSAVERLCAARAPLLARVSGTLPLAVVDPALVGHRADVQPAQQIAAAARGLRQPAGWVDHGANPRTGLVATVRVRMPNRMVGTGVRHRELLLLAVSEIGQDWPAEVWLTNLTAAEPAALFWLSRLTKRVDRDLAEVADRVGVRDFAGRSFGGWHRHITLASAAHAVAQLSSRAEQRAA